jgi:hypothetical protein
VVHDCGHIWSGADVLFFPFRDSRSHYCQSLLRMIGLGLLAVAAAVVSALPSNTPLDLPMSSDVKRQYNEPPPVNTEQRAQAVVDVFKTSWEGYYTYAFPMDELRPVNNSGSNSRYAAITLYRLPLTLISSPQKRLGRLRRRCSLYSSSDGRERNRKPDNIAHPNNQLGSNRQFRLPLRNHNPLPRRHARRLRSAFWPTIASRRRPIQRRGPLDSINQPGKQPEFRVRNTIRCTLERFISE